MNISIMALNSHKFEKTPPFDVMKCKYCKNVYMADFMSISLINKTKCVKFCDELTSEEKIIKDLLE